MKKWTCSDGPELIPVPIDSRRYQSILADLAELIYDHFASLPAPSHLAPSIESTSKDNSRTHTPRNRAAEGKAA